MTELNPKYKYDEDTLELAKDVARMEARVKELGAEKSPGAAAAFIRLSRLQGALADQQSDNHEVQSVTTEDGLPEVICSCALMIPEAEYDQMTEEEWLAHPGHIWS